MSERSHGPWFYLMLVWLATLGMAGFITATVREGEDFLIPFTVIAGVVLVVLSRSQLGKALAERIRSGSEAALDEQALVELDELRARMVELEERQDFTERLLAQAAEAPNRIPRGVHE